MLSVGCKSSDELTAPQELQGVSRDIYFRIRRASFTFLGLLGVSAQVTIQRTDDG